MSTEGEEPDQRIDRTLNDIVRDADVYYNYLIGKHAKETLVEVAVRSVVAWLTAFIMVGLGSFAIFGIVAFESYPLLALVATGIAAATGLATYVIRRRRRIKFAVLGVLLNKMKEGGASTEDGLHLMDAVHQAALVLKKRKMDLAFEYGVITFVFVGLLSKNVAVGVLAGVIMYLYFRFRALRQYEREEKRYEESKKELLQSL